MPFLDGTGPLGQGPMTGRGMGRCTGAVGRGYGPVTGRGWFGRGRGVGFGRGFGRGMGRGYGFANRYYPWSPRRWWGRGGRYPAGPEQVYYGSPARYWPEW